MKLIFRLAFFGLHEIIHSLKFLAYSKLQKGCLTMKEAAVALSRHKKRVIQAAIPCDRHCVCRLKFCKRIQDSWIFKIDSTDWIVRAHGRSVRLPVCPACIPCGLKSWLVQRIVCGRARLILSASLIGCKCAADGSQ